MITSEFTAFFPLLYAQEFAVSRLFKSNHKEKMVRNITRGGSGGKLLDFLFLLSSSALYLLDLLLKVDICLHRILHVICVRTI